MNLPIELISEFVKATKDKDENQSKNEATVYGTTVWQNGKMYVQIDGSELLTPVTATADTIAGERVMVMIKNHTAIITGNISSPAARTDDMDYIKNIADDAASSASNANEVANQAKQTMSLLFDLVYPIGSIYTSVNAKSPADLFGGEWAQIKDTFLLTAGDTYKAGATGGEATHKLTVDEMPSHSHVIRVDWTDTASSMMINTVVVNGTPVGANTDGAISGCMGIDRGTSTESSGGSQAHNNMPPYLVVYAWQRIK